MESNWTQWGDRAAMFTNAAQVRTVMRAVLATLGARGCNLVGLDITGLPERDGLSVVVSQRPNFSTVLTSLTQEMKDFYAIYQANTD
jgi:hypothetical protein